MGFITNNRISTSSADQKEVLTVQSGGSAFSSGFSTGFGEGGGSAFSSGFSTGFGAAPGNPPFVPDTSNVSDSFTYTPSVATERTIKLGGRAGIISNRFLYIPGPHYLDFDYDFSWDFKRFEPLMTEDRLEYPLLKLGGGVDIIPNFNYPVRHKYTGSGYATVGGSASYQTYYYIGNYADYFPNTGIPVGRLQAKGSADVTYTPPVPNAHWYTGTGGIRLQTLSPATVLISDQHWGAAGSGRAKLGGAAVSAIVAYHFVATGPRLRTAGRAFYAITKKNLGYAQPRAKIKLRGRAETAITKKHFGYVGYPRYPIKLRAAGTVSAITKKNLGYVARPTSRQIKLAGAALYRLARNAIINGGTINLSGRADSGITDITYGISVGNSGRIRLSGTAVAKWTASPVVVPTDGVVLTAMSDVSVTLPFSGSGGITLSGETEATRFTTSLDVRWNVVTTLSLDLEVGWNFSTPVLHYYRIEGECIGANCETANFDAADPKCGYPPDGQRFIEVIAAYDVADVCRKLKAKFLNYPWKWPIKSIKKFSRPVYLDDIQTQEAEGVDHTCNTLIEQQFCRVPDCYDFCGGETLMVNVGAKSFIPSGGEFNTDFSSDFNLLGEEPVVQIMAKEEPIMAQDVIELGPSVIPVYEPPLALPTGTVTVACGCGPLPLVLYMNHELNRSNELKSFVDHNRLVLPSEVALRHNGTDGMWRRNFHFAGTGSGGDQERWSLLFEWGCLDGDDGLAWRFGTLIRRTMMLGGVTKETRLLCTFDTNSPCFRNALDFQFTMNTQRGGSATSTVPAVITVQAFNDDIGLFRTRNWLSSPLMKFRIATATAAGGVEQFDISPLFPQPLTRRIPLVETLV